MQRKKLSSDLEMPQYSQLFHSLNASLYGTDEIKQALVEEKEPEFSSRYRGVAQRHQKNVSNGRNSREEFDLNWSNLKNFAYFSVLLVFARRY